MKLFLHLIGMAVFVGAGLVPGAIAGEYAVLRSGLRLYADRHEVEGTKLRLFSGAEGLTELPESAVVRFEVDDSPVPELSKAPKPAPIAVETKLPVVIPIVQTPRELARSAAQKFALPESFVRSVMQAESGFQASALSPKGAIGLMQLMPGTALELGVDPRDPKQNAEGGAHYLRDLLAKYEASPDQVVLALAAYNAGPGAVEKYHGVPPYAETRQYIMRVLKNWERDGSSVTANANP